MTLYSRSFYDSMHGGSLAAATRILQLLAPSLPCKRFLDVGCGSGEWLQAARTVFGLAASQVVGIDGVHTRALHRAEDATYVYQDLETPLAIDGTFDLAVCMEVAEHLTPGRASLLVEELAQRANVVVFAAAIPGQGGTGHINEQWAAYWFGKFDAQGFVAVDAVRHKVWRDGDVPAWYSQNTFVYVRNLDALPGISPSDVIRGPDDWRLHLVHPGIFELAGCETAGAGRLLRALPGRVAAALSRRIRR